MPGSASTTIEIAAAPGRKNERMSNIVAIDCPAAISERSTPPHVAGRVRYRAARGALRFAIVWTWLDGTWTGGSPVKPGGIAICILSSARRPARLAASALPARPGVRDMARQFVRPAARRRHAVAIAMTFG